MNTTFNMGDRFGSFLCDGDVANKFRFTELEPLISRNKPVSLDFQGVTNMTSSFCNALVATLMANHPTEFRECVRFANVGPAIKELIRSAISLGVRESLEGGAIGHNRP